MGKQKEGSLQERIQKFIKQRGGYCFKNHGDMATEPGRPDIVCCYKGLFVAIEAKVDNNKPSPSQGIHCRNIWKAGGIACIVWDVSEVDLLLNAIDMSISEKSIETRLKEIKSNIDFRSRLDFLHIDDGTRW